MDDAHFQHGPRRKLERATEHLHAVNARAENLRARSDLHSILMEHDASNGEYVICQPTTFDPRQGALITGLLESFGTVLGDFVHNTRGALDLVTWRLARLKLGREPTEDEARQIQFPIFNRPEDFAGARVLAFIPDDPTQEIERLQPYHAADPAKHPLALLHWYSNRDKHRLITPSFGQMTGDSLVWEIEGGEAQIRPIERDYESEPLRWYEGHIELGRVALEVTSGDPKLSLKRQPSMDIRFSGPGYNVDENDLRRLLDVVRDAVERLERFF